MVFTSGGGYSPNLTLKNWLSLPLVVRKVPAVGEELRMGVFHHAAAGVVAEDEAGLVEGGGGIVDVAVGVVAVVGAAGLFTVIPRPP